MKTDRKKERYIPESETSISDKDITISTKADAITDVITDAITDTNIDTNKNTDINTKVDTITDTNNIVSNMLSLGITAESGKKDISPPFSAPGQKLLKNTLLIGCGSVCSRCLQFLMIPFYTRMLRTEDYGDADLMQALVQLLFPVITMAIYEAVFRFTMDSEKDKNQVFTVGFAITGIGSAIFLLACIVFGRIYPFITMKLWLTAGNTIAVALWTLLAQYARAIGKMNLYAGDTFLSNALAAVLNIFFLRVLGLEIFGYMLGYILANFAASLYLLIKLRKDICLVFPQVRRKLVFEMAGYAFPLVLNGICWWISSFTDRVMIRIMISASAAGLYAAASKVPHLLSAFALIFCQAWEISANEEYSRKGSADFFTEVFHKMGSCLFLLSFLLIAFCRIISLVFLGEQYSQAWTVMPALTFASVFFSFAAFLQSIDAARKKTHVIFLTNLLCVLVNIGMNWILIRIWEAPGAAAATAVSYGVLWIIRAIRAGKISAIRFYTKEIILFLALLIVQAFAICFLENDMITFIIFVIAILCFYKTNHQRIGGCR